MGRVERGQVQPREYLRVAQGERSAVGDRHAGPEAHVLVGGGGVPVDPGDPEVAGTGGEDLDGQRVARPRMGEPCHGELVAAERARDLVGSGDPLAVEPDVGAVVDPVEAQPERAAGRRGRQRELRAVPPGRAERAVAGHGQVGEVLSDRVRGARQRAEGHAEVGIGIGAVADEGADDRARNGRAMPALGPEANPGHRLPLDHDLPGGLDRPAGIEGLVKAGRIGGPRRRRQGEQQRRRARERPRPLQARPAQERGDTRRERKQAHLHVAPARRQEDVGPPGQGHDRGHGVQPHLEGARVVGQPLAQQRHRDDLPDELHDHPGGDEGGDDLVQAEERRDDRHRAQDVERDVGELLGRVDVREGLEEVALDRGRERDARIAEEQREDRPERGPQDHQRDRHRRPPPVQPLHELRDHVLRVEHLPPGDHAEEREVEQEVPHRAPEDREEDRARDHARRVPDLVADVADVVVAQVVVDRDEGRAAQAEHEAAVEVEGPGGEVERARGVKAREAGGHHRQHRRHRPHPQRHRQAAEERDPPRQQDDGEQARGRAHVAAPPAGEARPQIACVLPEADEPGGDLERSAQHERPDEQERHEPPPAGRSVGLAEEAVAAARAGQGRAQLAPHLPVAQHDEGPHPPAQQRLGASHGGHQEGDGDERADPHHVGHVEGGGVQEAEAAGEVGTRGGGRRDRLHVSDS